MSVIRFLFLFSLFMVGVNILWVAWEIYMALSRRKEKRDSEDMSDWFL
ncbi:hypothetical protein HZI73_22225 [Vallitalea pronyensis]|uniref:Uncharacterized protein n=1 Tax=Vallitalea pronyensis TaxID=1348613 RepID=A0A8J8MNP7_9FIRM|nr:hypothetical protein [Vallitalea pronyensis]QUI24849.1 hypothetical protein HZI73_22225 [Vallitalea pronyensis]